MNLFLFHFWDDTLYIIIACNYQTFNGGIRNNLCEIIHVMTKKEQTKMSKDYIINYYELHKKFGTYKESGDGSDEIPAIPIRIIRDNVSRARLFTRCQEIALSVTVIHNGFLAHVIGTINHGGSVSVSCESVYKCRAKTPCFACSAISNANRALQIRE